MKVKFIRGHNPEVSHPVCLTAVRANRPGRVQQLHIYEDFGTLIEKVDLSRMTTQKIHDMFIEKGFKRNPAYMAKLRGVA